MRKIFDIFKVCCYTCIINLFICITFYVCFNIHKQTIIQQKNIQQNIELRKNIIEFQ
jgi:hypothetical protein